jgi:hypothetical protein
MRCKHFLIQELVPPEVYDLRKDAAWELLDFAALLTLDTLRDAFGALIVNNWHAGGAFKESGYRSLTTPTGARFSQHKFGRAFDCKFENVTPEEAALHILSNPSKFVHLTTLEDPAKTKTWLHFDVRNNDKSGIWIVEP